MEDLLIRPRSVTTEWHLGQAKRLLKVAIGKQSPTALVYAALEARNAIERFVVEMSILATGGRLTDKQIQTAQHKDGAFRLLDAAMQNYRKHLEFTNLILKLCGDSFRVVIPDLRKCKRLRTALSDYCHFFLDPKTTVEDPTGQWFSHGVSEVREATRFLTDLLSQPSGAINRDSMAPEVRDLFDQYLADRRDSESVRIQLKLMQPTLEARQRLSKLTDRA